MKLTPAIRAHLPAAILEDVESGDPVLGHASALMTHGILKLTNENGDHTFWYRGVEIHSNDTRRAGASGRWSVGLRSGRTGIGYSTGYLRNCIAFIERQRAREAEGLPLTAAFSVEVAHQTEVARAATQKIASEPCKNPTKPRN